MWFNRIRKTSTESSNGLPGTTDSSNLHLCAPYEASAWDGLVVLKSLTPLPGSATGSLVWTWLNSDMCYWWCSWLFYGIRLLDDCTMSWWRSTMMEWRPSRSWLFMFPNAGTQTISFRFPEKNLIVLRIRVFLEYLFQETFKLTYTL